MAALTLQIAVLDGQKETEIFIDGVQIGQHFSVPAAWTEMEIYDLAKARCTAVGYEIS